MTHSEIKSTEFAAYVGIDWADQKLNVSSSIALSLIDLRSTERSDLPSTSAVAIDDSLPPSRANTVRFCPVLFNRYPQRVMRRRVSHNVNVIITRLRDFTAPALTLVGLLPKLNLPIAVEVG